MSVFKLLKRNQSLITWCRLTNAARTQFSTGPSDPSDIELSYTTYPNHEHSIDPKKKTLMFLHGLFGSKGNLHSISKHLSDNGRKVISYDARNHGDSQHNPEMNYTCMADDLSGLIKDLNLSKPVVLGHSMGGKTAMSLALAQPDSMTALVVADVAPNRSPGTGNIKKFAEAMKALEIPRGISVIQARRLAQAHLTPVVENRGIVQFLLTNLKEYEGGEIRWRVNLDAVLKNYDCVAGFPEENFAPFTKPTLFVFGANSEHFKNADHEKMKTLFPNSQVTAIDGAGHFLHADKPLEFVRIVNQFLEKIDSKAV